MERVKSFTLKGNSYKVEFPTAGQFIDIETKKAELSNGQWGQLIKSPTISTFRSIQIIECIATLSIICPQLISDLKVKRLEDLDLIDLVEIYKVYQKNIYPWYTEWFQEFNKAFGDLDSDNTNEEKKE